MIWPPRIKSREVEARIALRLALQAAQGGVCAICGDDLKVKVWEFPKWNRGSIEHVIPKAWGGGSGVGNVVAAHVGCNSFKGDRPPTGCELIWLMAVNARIGAEPVRW